MIKDVLRALVPKGVWRVLRLARIRYGVARYRVRDVHHSYGNVRLMIHLADPMAEGWYDRDWPELEELTLLKTGKLKPGATVFDLGAHQGVVAMQLAAIVGSSGRIVAVEANPHNAAIARRNALRNEMKQIEVVNAAVSDSPGKLVVGRSLNSQVDDGAGEWGRLTVRAITIDELAGSHGMPDVLFIDVEGFEGHALRGAERALAGHPDCFVEVHVGAGLEKFGATVESILRFFPREGYECFVASDPDHSFQLLSPSSPLLAHRFFLVALSRP